MCNYSKIHPLVKEKKSFKGFSIFSSGDHLVQQSETVCAIPVEDHPRNIPEMHPLVEAEKSFK